jgi:hypothetical protein
MPTPFGHLVIALGTEQDEICTKIRGSKFAKNGGGVESEGKLMLEIELINDVTILKEADGRVAIGHVEIVAPRIARAVTNTCAMLPRNLPTR